MPIRRGMGGLSSGAGGNLFDRPGFFDNAEIVNLTVDTKLLLKAASETYGIEITHGDTSGASQDYAVNIPALSADGELVITTATQTLTNKTIADLRLPAIYDSNGNEMFKFTATSSAVNEITLANAAASNPPVFSASGSDTNIDIKLQPKGSGKVHITGGLQVDGTTTTVNSTTLSVDDKNIEMGSVASPSDSTADGGGITLKGDTDKTLIWDNSNDNWTSSEHFNLASGKTFKINNVAMVTATALGTSIVGSSLTSVGALNSGSITSGFGAIDTGSSNITTTGTVTGGQLTVDNITINGNTISSSTGNITFDAASSLDFGDDSVLNVGTITLDAIHGDNNAIQVGDNSDDAVSIYRVNALTAIGDLDIGAHDLRASTITADGLTAGRVVYSGTNGVLSEEAGFEYNASTNTLQVNTITPSTINAFTLGGKLTAGSSEIEGSAFDIDGGTVDAITSLTVANNVDVGNYTVRANNFLADSHTATRIFFAGTDGALTTDSDLTFATDTLTVTKIGAFTAVGSIDFDDEQLTNVNIDSGVIDAVTLGSSSAVTVNSGTIGGALTWSAAQNLNSQALTNVNIDSGTANLLTSFGIKQAATAYEMQIAAGTTTLTANRVLTLDVNNAARAIEISGNVTFGNDFITGNHSLTLTTSGTTDVTFPTTGTLSTLAGNETLTNKTLIDASTSFADNSDNTKKLAFQLSSISTNTTRTLTIPNSSGTIVLQDDAVTLTNKTISGGDNTLSNIANSSLSNSTITMAASSGSNDAIALGETFTITAGAGIDTTMGSNAVTISGEDATTSNKGIASFSSDNFAVSSGAVTIKDGGVANAELVNSSITVSDGSSTTAIALGGTLTFSDDNFGEASGTITLKDGGVANAELANSTITMAASAGSSDAIALGETFTITAGDGIDTTMGTNSVTIAGEDATTSNKGIASFSSTNFDVSSGAVTIKDGGVANAELVNSSITVSDGSNTSPVALGGTITFAAGEGIDVAESSGTVTFSGEDATTSNKGVASFNSANFAVSSGDVTIKDGGVANAELVNSTITIGGTATALGGTITALTALTDLDLTAGNKTIFDTVGANTLTIGASGTTVNIAGNLTVAGTTTTVNSTTVTIADPIFNLGGTSAPSSDDNKDRGISFRWHDGSNAKIGFFGYDDSAGKLTFIPDATINSEVVSGSTGTIVAATFEGALSGNATTATTATNITASANNSTNETVYLTFVDGATGAQGIETDTGLSYNPSTGALTATSFSGTVSGNIDTATEATNVTVVANNSTDETTYLTFVDGATGTQGIETDTGLTYNPSSGVLTATSFTGALTGNVTGNVSGSSGSTTGNAATATALATARTIGGTSFDGTSNIAVALSATATALANARTIGGVSFDGTSNINLPGVNTSGNQDTSGNATTATTATNITASANNSTDETVYLTFVDGATGSQGIETDTGLSYNPSTGVLTTTSVTGNLTGNVTGNVSGSSGSTTGNAATATALATGRTIGMTGDVVWTSASFDGSGNVTGSATIQSGAVETAMVNANVITGQTEMTSGVATDADFVLLYDTSAGAYKKVKPDNLGISGSATGSSNEIQYNNSNEFAAAANVEIKNAALALKEMATPSAASGYGLIYAKSDNELYYRNDTNSEVKITSAGSLAGGGAFRGIRAYLTNANNSINNNSATTPTAWTESYDVGAIHDGSSNTDRFTFGQVGYYEIKIQQEWEADTAGYREMRVTHVDTSNSNATNVILRDKVTSVSSQTTTVSGASTTFYVDDTADYVTVQLYQNSGAALNAIGNNDDGTNITITRIDIAAQASNASGAAGRVQFSDGSGGFSSDSDLTFSTDTLTATKIGAFTAAGAIDFDNQNMTNVDIDSGDIASGVTINKSPVITLGGDLTGNATLSTLGNATLTATIASTSVEGSMLNNNVISGQTALTSGLASTDELFVSDGGTLKRMDVSVLSTYQAALSETLTNKTLTTPTIGDMTNATHDHADNAGGGVIPISNTSGTLAVARGGTGATTLNDLITLGTHTTGSYVATITGGTGITSSAGTSGEGTTHSLSVDASQTQITAVGALNAGSITSGFTSIDVGSGAISTTGTSTTGALVIGGDISTAAAQDWDLVDNNASALSFDAAGKSGILEIVTTNGSEKVAMSGDLTVAGNMTVTGTTTQVNTVTMNAQNAVIFEGATADNYETTLTIVDPTADHSVYMPNQSGYLPVLAAASTTQVSSTPEELNILDGVTSTTAELNLLDGSSANTVVNSKAVIYGSSGEVAGTLSTAAQTNVTSLGTLTSLTVDDITIDGSTISDSGALTVDIGGNIDLDTGGTEILLSSAGTQYGRIGVNHSDLAGGIILESTVSDKDIRIRGNDGGSMINALHFDMSSNAGASFYGGIYATDRGASAARFYSSADSGDQFKIDVTTHGATTLTTIDDDAAAAHLQITADGTVDIDSAGALTLDSGAAINLEPASGSVILLDGTISVDAGVITGATSITSTAFVGTLSTAAQTNITSLGTLTGLTVNGAAVFNENSADVDFRIESNANTHMFFVDAGNNKIGINQSSPVVPLHVNTGGSGTNSAQHGIIIDATTTGTAAGGFGSGMLFRAESAGGSQAYQGKFEYIYNDATDSAEDTRFDLYNTVNGSLTKQFSITETGAGIGVDNPDQKLEVAGAIHMSGEVSTPSQPSGGDGGIMYVKSDGKLYWRSNEISETDLTSGGGAVSAVANGADNRIATFSSADALNGEANLTFNGTTLQVGANSDARKLIYDDSNVAREELWGNVSWSSGTSVSTNQYTYDVNSNTGGDSLTYITTGLHNANTSGYWSLYTRESNINAHAITANDGRVAIGTISSTDITGGANHNAKLLVQTDSGTPIVELHSTSSGADGPRIMFSHNTTSLAADDDIGALNFRANHDTSAGGDWIEYARIAPRVLDVDNSEGKCDVRFTTITYQLAVTAKLAANGQWTNASDASLKIYEGTAHSIYGGTEGRVITDKLKTLNVGRYRYTNTPVGKENDKNTERRIGPTAQDFYNAFGTGTEQDGLGYTYTDKEGNEQKELAQLAPGDVAGVGLMAIKELIKRIEDLEAEVTALKSE